MWNLKDDTNELFKKKETDSQMSKTSGYERENGGRRNKLGLWG